jgi:glycerol kinase
MSAAHIKGNQIAAIGITNQRETTVVWDKRTGQPIYHAIVWQDRRTSERCNQLKDQGRLQEIQSKTGLVIDAYFSATKVEWILKQVPGAQKLAEEGHLAFGTVDSWLIWKFSEGQSHVTDVTNASRTMLYNIRDQKWDEELLNLFSIPSPMLPRVMESSDDFGSTSEQFFGHRIPITGVAGDQQAALFGQMCTEVGMVKNTYGTGCFMLMNIGPKFVHSKHNLLTTIAWKINGTLHYALEGSVFIAGAVVQWLRDGMEIIRHSSEIEDLAKQSTHTDGVYFVPAFAGLGAPYWNQEARGMLVGLSRGTTKSHIARAALESMAYQSYDVLKAMEADSGISIKELRVDGGATTNNLLMQFQADLLGANVIRPKHIETTALGTAYLAGLRVGYWENIEEIQSIWTIDHRFKTRANGAHVSEAIDGWNKAIHAVQAWTTYS